MFENGFFPLASQLQGSAGRTWNYVSQFAKLVWFKFNHLRPSAVMPRSRRRHHSRSRSRSRSHSHDRDRDAKRRKIETTDESPPTRKSISSDHEDEANSGGSMEVEIPREIQNTAVGENSGSIKDELNITNNPLDQNVQAVKNDEIVLSSDDDSKEKTDADADLSESGENKLANVERMEDLKEFEDKILPETVDVSSDESSENDSKEKVCIPKSSDHSSSSKDSPSTRRIIKTLEASVTPNKPLTPKQLQKKQESEKKRLEKLKQREEREKQKQEERERLKLEKLKIKQEEKEKRNKELQEKLEQKQKEKELKEEQKRKEKEEREQKRKEKEEREEQKRKEKENERLKKQQELEEKNKEKQKQEEQRQKTSAAFKNFFVTKKSDDDKRSIENDAQKKGLFKSFEIKSDMRLAPLRREPLSEIQKNELIRSINSSESTYLKDIKCEKTGKCGKTWLFEESENEVIIIEDEKGLGEALCEEQQKPTKMRAKFLKFHENRRPAYFGTWRKVNKLITGRRPFSRDTELLNYEEDSDDDWEEEEQGESLDDSDGDDKEEATNDDYEVDNDFFVPHGHLSDDEVDDEATAKMSPESHKQKLKLLKDEFDLDMKSKTNKIKPRFIGCIWYKKDGKNVDEVIDRYLQPFSMIIDGLITIKKRNEVSGNELPKPEGNVKNLDSKLIPEFIKMIHRNISNRKTLVADFIAYMNENGYDVNISKATLSRNIKRVATWIRCPESGSMFNKFCWYVPEEIRKKYAVELCQSESE